jgi:disulfide bond formation protein DsbB
MMKKISKAIQKNVLYIALTQVIVSLLGSLYFSEFLHFQPCTLCWYQRILMYPLLVILTVGISRKDNDVPYYVLPLSITGVVVAFYQVLLERGIVPEVEVCSVGVPCNTIYINWLGFITIPFLSLVAFLIITFCMVVYKGKLKNQSSKIKN